MLKNPSGKQSCRVMAMSLVFFILSAFVFSVFGITNDIEMRDKNPCSPAGNGILTSFDSAIDWLSVEIKTVDKTGRNTFSPVRNIPQRELALLMKNYDCKNNEMFCIQSENTGYFLTNKDAIQLKLRI